MLNILSNDELNGAINTHQIIENGSTKNCEGIKYDFRLGEKILKASFKRPVIYSELTMAEQALCEIAPGEVVFVMTEEKLCLPNNIFCQLSNKRKIGHGGIIVLGGLMIDPGYCGRLIFGLYNVSSSPYQLKPGRKLIAGVFYKTDTPNVSFPVPEAMEDFPDDLVDSMVKYEPFSPTNANTQLDLLKKQIDSLESRFEQDNEWKTTFKKGLDDVSDKLDKIADKLDTEVTVRQEGQTKLEKKLAVLRGIGLVISGILGGGLVSLLAMWLGSMLHLT